MQIALRLTIRQMTVLGEILEDAAEQQEAWITAKHSTDEERKAARDKLVVIRSIQGEDI